MRPILPPVFVAVRVPFFNRRPDRKSYVKTEKPNNDRSTVIRQTPSSNLTKARSNCSDLVQSRFLVFNALTMIAVHLASVYCIGAEL